jgi:phosphate transport system substrate-binding protein
MEKKEVLGMSHRKAEYIVLVYLLFALIIPAPGVAADASLQALASLEGTIAIAGGTAHIPVMNDAAKNIMTFNPKVKITVEGGGSGVGAQKVGEGLVDIGNTGRPLSEEEVAKYGLRSFPFALDGVAVVVHPSNPASNLTAQQVRDIFAGKITNWKDVGGNDAAIHLFTRDEASGTREVFSEKLLKKGPVLESANVVPSNGAMKTAIAQDKDALGYVGIGHVDAEVKAVNLDGVAASQETSMNGSYPVVRKLYMNTKGEPSKLVKAFIDYILGADGAALSKKHGYIPLQ